MKDKVVKIIEKIKENINNKSLLMKVIIGIIIVILVFIVASSFRKTKYGNTVANSNNLGLAVQDGKWIYYIEIDDSEPVGICRVKNNAKKIKKVADGSIRNLNIRDNYIYCLEYNKDEDKTNLIKMKTNGKSKKILARDVENESIMVYENWIYYIKNSNLYRVRLDGTDREKISDKDISYYQIKGNYIYYIYRNNERKQYIAKMKLNGEDNERIAKTEEKESYHSLYVKGNRVYYILSELDKNNNYEYYLYKMNKKGEKVDQICKIGTNVTNINMTKNYIYYTTTDDHIEYEINSIKYNGTNKTTIKTIDNIQNINVTEDWIIILRENEDYETSLEMVRIDGKKEKDL